MLGRRILLALGTLALVAGIVLSVLWLRAPSTPVQPVAKVELQSVLMATRTVKARSLLRVDDLGWTNLAPGAVPAGSYLRGQASPADFAGAVTRRDLHPGDILIADQVVKVGEPGFLPSVLGIGMRALSIAVNPVEGASGLIVPGDRVDAVLTQSFSEAGLPLSRRSVGETVLSDLRVIAVDQTIAPLPGNEPKPGDTRSVIAAEQHLAKTVTLEVSAHDAEVLLVALQLGKIQLTLRNSSESRGIVPSYDPAATWGSDVSPALRSLDGGPANGPATGSPPAGTLAVPSAAIEILHAGQREMRCFNEVSRTVTDCVNGAPMPAAPVAPKTAPAVDVLPTSPSRTQ